MACWTSKKELQRALCILFSEEKKFIFVTPGLYLNFVWLVWDIGWKKADLAYDWSSTGYWRSQEVGGLFHREWQPAMLPLFEYIYVKHWFLASWCCDSARPWSISLQYSRTVRTLPSTQWLHLEYHWNKWMAWTFNLKSWRGPPPKPLSKYHSIPFKKGLAMNLSFWKSAHNKQPAQFERWETDGGRDRYREFRRIVSAKGENTTAAAGEGNNGEKEREDYDQKPVQDVFYFCSPGWKQENTGGKQKQKVCKINLTKNKKDRGKNLELNWVNADRGWRKWEDTSERDWMYMKVKTAENYG